MGYNTSLPPLVADLEAYNEYRGLSYSIGGDNDSFTVPNYVKHYQPNLTGYSIGEHAGEYCNGKLL
jgi:phospholipase B1